MLSKINNSLRFVHLRYAFCVAGNESIQQRRGSYNVRFYRESAKAFHQHKNWVIAAYIIGAAIFHQIGPRAIGRPGVAVMQEM